MAIAQLSTIDYQRSTIDYQRSTINDRLSTLNSQLLLMLVAIRKFFKKIQHRLLLLLVLSTLIPTSLVGWYGVSSSTAALQTLALNNLAESVAYSAEKLVKILENMSDDVLFLSKSPPIQETYPKIRFLSG